MVDSSCSAARALVCLCVLAVIPSVCDAQCSVPMCFGCGGTYIDCRGASLTSFPAFSDAVAEQVESLYASGVCDLSRMMYMYLCMWPVCIPAESSGLISYRSSTLRI